MRGRNLWEQCGVPPFCLSKRPIQKSRLSDPYDLPPVVVADVDDVSKGGDDIDIDASE